MKVYVIEYKTVKSLISKIISFITGMKYSHTAMIIEKKKNELYFCELDAQDDKPNESDYHVYKHDTDIKTWLQTNSDKDRTEAFLVPYKFTRKGFDVGIKWWKDRQDKKYGYVKISMFLWLAKMRPFFRRYYRKTGKPYQLKMDTKSDVCSVAVDTCLKKMGYDIFPEYSERVTYPGLFAKKLKDYKV